MTHEDRLAHEWELLPVPEVAVVDSAHQDVGEDDADVLVDLEPDRVVQAARADEVPVERPRQQAHALVVARATEDVAEHQALVVREAENGNTGEEREYPYEARGVSLRTAGPKGMDTYTAE